MSKYVIRNEDTGDLISGVGIGTCNIDSRTPVEWTKSKAYALHFELEEAEATINFINDVIDWELAQQLIVEQLKL